MLVHLQRIHGIDHHEHPLMAATHALTCIGQPLEAVLLRVPWPRVVLGFQHRQMPGHLQARESLVGGLDSLTLMQGLAQAQRALFWQQNFAKWG